MAYKDQTTIKFIHQFPDDYRIVPANGAWGGVSPRGDLLMHLFVEHSQVPREEIQIVKEDGSLAPLKKTTKEIEVMRTMQIGVVLNVEQAVSIAKWMLEKVEKYKSAQKVEKTKMKQNDT